MIAGIPNEGSLNGFGIKLVPVMINLSSETKTTKLPKMRVIRISPIQPLIRALPFKLGHGRSIYEVGGSENALTPKIFRNIKLYSKGSGHI